MRHITLLAILMTLTMTSCNIFHNGRHYHAYVNTIIGTDKHGHTYPGATAPFGMVQVSPDTRNDMSWDGCSGYHYSDSVIYGFSNTHLSGTGCFDLCDLLLMPLQVEDDATLADLAKRAHFTSKFSHDDEKGEAGYYHVYLDDNQVDVELTSTVRTGYHRYTFEKGSDGVTVLDLNHQDKVLSSSVEVVNQHEIAGKRFSRSWADRQTLYYVIIFSRDFDEFALQFNDSVVEAGNVEGTNVRGFFRFNDIITPVELKVGISYVSIENARKNIDYSMDFDDAKDMVQSLWDKELAKIDVQPSNREDLEKFYTALYHTMIVPNLYSDVNGDYLGRDMQVHHADHDYYHVFSLWDTYRALHPLHSIINQQRTNDFINTFLLQYKQGGRLPVWELCSNETNCMIGNHAVPVILDAFSKGIRNYDLQLALEAMINSVEGDGFGLDDYRTNGYISSEDESESVSKTLEYSYDDWCVAMFARHLFNDSIYGVYGLRSQNYKNIFDVTTKFHRAKYHNMWALPFDPKEVNFNYTEANCWQYNFHVQHDINGMIDLCGGDVSFSNHLDQFFYGTSEITGRKQSDIDGLIGQYAHGNEPSHHDAYLYNYVGMPYKTQQLVRQIMDDMYTTTPAGLIGNEDCGQMSAWYVFGALGFYPVCPGDNKFVIGSPCVEAADIYLENGRVFKIEVVGQSKENIYINKIELNGMDYDKSYLTYDDILHGGEIIFYMSDVYNSNFGRNIEDRPINRVDGEQMVPVPYFDCGSLIFNDEMEVKIKSQGVDDQIYYTLDGSEPTSQSTLYVGPFVINKDTQVSAVCVNAGGSSSRVVTTLFRKMPNYRKVILGTRYSSQYAAGGDMALADYIRGGADFRTGGWQGYHGTDIEAVVDLGNVKWIKEVSMGFLQDIKSWIFYPTEVEYYISEDGLRYVHIGTVVNEKEFQDYTVSRQEIGIDVGVSGRYVKVIAKSIKRCPAWHEASGEPAWLFSDEISIQ